jgi:class 3 adenylate cyclase
VTVRIYLILLISISALGAGALVGGLALAYQDLEHEQEAQLQSAKSLDDLSYMKEDLNRLATTGDLIFGSTKGLNSYLAQPAIAQLTQIDRRLVEVSERAQLKVKDTEKLTTSLKDLQVLFTAIHQGKIEGNEYDRYDQLSFGAIRSFQALYKNAKSLASRDQESLNAQKAYLKEVAWFLSLLYLALVIFITWWSNRSISVPVSNLSKSAGESLDQGVSFPLESVGPLELQALSEVLYRLINQLEGEVSRKTKDLEEENKERRRVEVKLRVLNERQRALVDASVRFVPRPFLEFLGRSDLTLVQRGDSTRQRLGILFSDLRGFTSLAEGKEPQYIFELLNRYLDAVVPAIHENNGFVDKYIGDAIMALFPSTPKAAIQAGIDMFHRLYKFVDHDEQDLKMGVGLHWGEVILGTLGSEDRWESTVIGDTVNLAARLEGMTKIYSCPLIISDSLVDALETQEDFDIRPLDLVRVKGRKAPVTIYEVVDAHPLLEQEARKANRIETNKGFALYREGHFSEAKSMFITARKISPSDPISDLFITRCDELLNNQLNEEWSGVYTHTSK